MVPGLPDDVIAGPRTDLWFTVLRRQSFPLALMAYHPGDLAAELTSCRRAQLT